MAAEAIAADRVAVDGIETDRVSADGIDTGRIAADGIETDRVSADCVETGRVSADGIETDSVSADGIETDRVSADGIAAARIAAGGRCTPAVHSRRYPLMFRALLLALGFAIVLLVGLYFFTAKTRYLSWAWRLFLAGLALGAVFFVVLFVKRLT